MPDPVSLGGGFADDRLADHPRHPSSRLAGAAAGPRTLRQPLAFRRFLPAIRRGWRLWLGAAVLAAVLGGAVVWLAHPDRSGAGFVEYRMLQPLDTPTAIAAAPDGTIWFTIDLAAAMGRIRDGRLERLSLPGNNVEPIGLGVGPDGSAWYTDNSARAISRITPTGEISN